MAADPSASRGVSSKDLKCCIKLQPPWCTHREEEKEETKMRRSKRKEQLVVNWGIPRQGTAILGFQLVLFLILLGFKV